MKKFKNFITENKEFVSLKEKILFLYNNDIVDKNKKLKELININSFDYDFKFEKPKHYEKLPYLLIGSTSDNISDYLDVEDYYLKNAINYYFDDIIDAFVDYEELIYHLNDNNKDLYKKILNNFSIKFNDNNINEYTIKLLKILNNQNLEIIINVLNNFISLTKQERTVDVFQEHNFELELYNLKNTNDNIYIKFNLNNDKIFGDAENINEWFDKQQTMNFSFLDSYDINSQYQEELNNIIVEKLTDFLNISTVDMNIFINDLYLFDNLKDITKMGGLLLNSVKDYNFQKKFLDYKHTYLSNDMKIDLLKNYDILTDEAEHYYNARTTSSKFNL